MTRRSADTGGRVAVFAGSFDPFTLGHHDIVVRALGIFDRVVVCVGVNCVKSGGAPAGERAAFIRAVYAGEPRVSVDVCDGATADYARRIGACALVRGVRSVKDFEYERDMADANQRLGGITTVMLCADPAHSWISSSLVRELRGLGRDVSDLLPPHLPTTNDQRPNTND